MNQTLPPPDSATYVPPAQPAPTRRRDRFVRPRDGRRLGGVCAGIADYNGWDRTVVRLVAVLSILLPGPQVIAYLVAWLVLPDEGDGQRIVDVNKVADEARDVVRA